MVTVVVIVAITVGVVSGTETVSSPIRRPDGGQM